MKKLTFMLICLVLLFSLSGCGEKQYVETTLADLEEEWVNMKMQGKEPKTKYVTIYATVNEISENYFTACEGSFSATCTINDEELQEQFESLSTNCAVIIKGKIESFGSTVFAPTIVVSELINEGPALLYTRVDGGYSVTGIGEFAGTDLVIPATYRWRPVVSIDRNAFASCASLEIP